MKRSASKSRTQRRRNPRAISASRLERKMAALEQNYLLEPDWTKKKKIELAINKIQDALLALPWDERGMAPRIKKAKKRKNKTIIKAKSIGHLDVSRVHNPRRRNGFLQTAKKYTGKALQKIGGKLANPRKRTLKKANRADITNIVRDYIRQGLNSREISAQMKEAGFSKDLITEAKTIYKRELAYVKGQPVKRPISRAGKKIDIEALRSKQRAALKGVKLRNPGPYSIWVKKTADADYTVFAKGLSKKAAEEKAKYLNVLQSSFAVIDGAKPAFTMRYVASKEKPASNRGRKANAGRKNAPPLEWQVRALPGGRFEWQMRQEWQDPDDVYKREFNHAFDLEYDLTDKFGARFAKQVLKAAKAAGGNWTGNRKKNPRKAAKKKRNDGAVERREKFAGHYNGDKELYFPEGTPGGLSTLGPLNLIITDAGELEVRPGVYLCQDAKGRLHLGATKNTALYVGPVKDFGQVYEVEYRCKKPHLNEPDNVDWYHEFESPYPRLKADGRGGLKFHGGGYTIEPEGITG